MKPLIAFCVIVAYCTATAAVPSNEDDLRLSQLMVGKWRSPRHDYLYAADGTWRMLLPATTHGLWRIENRQLIISWSGPELRDRTPARYEIQHLDKDEILYGGVYHMKRLPD